MALSVDEFFRRLQASLQKHLPSSELKINENNSLRLKARVILSQTTFIDVFYGAKKERIDSALIHEGKRVFGIDNLNYWHCHPFKKEKNHFRIEPMTIENIIIELSKNIDKVK